MQSRIESFYNSLADVYHLIYEDWDRSIARQGRAIDELLKRRVAPGSLDILDCACGIGTQTLGLAALGHHLTGSDLSTAAVERARGEALKRGVDARFYVSDMATLTEMPTGQFDAVCVLDNALPHLSAERLLKAAKSFARVLRPGGTFMASIRDYDVLIEERPVSQVPSFFGPPGNRRIIHQVWDWKSEDRYEVHLYITTETGEGWRSLHFVSEYRRLLRSEVDTVLCGAGFSKIEWQTPETTGFYQPVVLTTLF
jgi:SAM-dependent methyltransferase